MSGKIFTERFCEIKKIKVCTTTAELDFNAYTEPGTYEIYEDMGDGRSRIYFLTVDNSVTGACVKQTRIYCGKVETRQTTTSGTWTAWAAVTGGSSQPSDGSGVPLISVHDDAYNTIVPEDGQVYVVKYHDMPYGADPSLISPEVFYRLRIGDGVTPLCDIPNVSNIVAGTGNGSAILVDPTYDNGDDGLEAPKNVADAQYAVAFGKYLKNYGKASAVFNYSNENHAPRAFVAGQSNVVNKNAIIALVAGYENNVDAYDSAVFGQKNTIKGKHIFNYGFRNSTDESAYFITLLGTYLTSNSSNSKGQTVIGTYNEEDEDALLIFGAGTSNSNRRNVFKVMRDGTVELFGTIKVDGEEIDFEAVNEAAQIPQKLKDAVAETLIPQNMYVDVSGNLAFEDMEGELTTLPEYNFILNGHSDVTSSSVSSYTEYPTDGESDRQWAWLGTTGSPTASSGVSANITAANISLVLWEKEQWAAFSILVAEDGIYTVSADYIAYKNSGSIETYILPMTDEMREEFAYGNEDTYGTLTGTGSMTREGAKLFPDLTSIAGAVPIGDAVDMYAATETAIDDKKLGTVTLTAGEHLLLFRGTTLTRNCMKFKKLRFTRFEPLTNAIKIGDTVLSEEEVVDLKTHREEIDDINAQLGDIGAALDAIIAIQEEIIGG